MKKNLIFTLFALIGLCATAQVQLPYSCNLGNEDDLAAWTVVEQEADGVVWHVSPVLQVPEGGATINFHADADCKVVLSPMGDASLEAFTVTLGSANTLQLPAGDVRVAFISLADDEIVIDEVEVEVEGFAPKSDDWPIPPPLYVFPTVTANVVNVASPTPVTVIEVYSVQGRNLIHVDEQYYTDLSALPAGTYLVRVVTEDGQESTHRVVRQ